MRESSRQCVRVTTCLEGVCVWRGKCKIGGASVGSGVGTYPEGGKYASVSKCVTECAQSSVVCRSRRVGSSTYGTHLLQKVI